jgi:tRNA pseudouridine38-40 synthase
VTHPKPTPPAPAPLPATTHFRAVCAYDGGRYHGWQSQTNAVAVQDVIERALAKVVGSAVRIHGSGRTDTGVHALAQVFHFDAVWPREPAKLLAALGAKLPAGVQVKSIQRAKPDFHARFQTTGKRYHYRIHLGYADPFEDAYCWSVPRALDFAAMEEAAAILRGRHDFVAFCATSNDERETTVRELRRLELRRRGRRLRVILEADGFLYKMARSLVGTLVYVGTGRLTPADVARVLASRQRIPRIATAPAHGLFLERVFYD